MLTIFAPNQTAKVFFLEKSDSELQSLIFKILWNHFTCLTDKLMKVSWLHVSWNYFKTMLWNEETINLCCRIFQTMLYACVWFDDITTCSLLNISLNFLITTEFIFWRHLGKTEIGQILDWYSKLTAFKKTIRSENFLVIHQKRKKRNEEKQFNSQTF